VDVSTERLARNQALFREVNERIHEIKPTAGFTELVCECSVPSCTQTLAVRAGEYESVRLNPRRFLVAHGHALPELEVVVDDNERFLVVEKTVETEFMAETDPRTPEEA
jgi:hypothetical protein